MALEAPFDHERLLALLAALGAGEEAVQRALREQATNEPASTQDVASARRRLAHDVVFQLFLPFKAISEAAGELPVAGDDGTDSADSDADSFGGHSPAGSPALASSTQNGPAVNCPVQTYIFPPSPLTALGQPASDDNPHVQTAVEAARCLGLLDPQAAALLQRTAHDLAANTVMLHRDWSHAFARFEAAVEPQDPDAPGGDLLIRAVGKQSLLQEEPFPLPSTSSPERRLLALHANIARILHETRAGAVVDGLLSDNVHAEDLAGDGGTRVGLLMQLRLDGWCPASRRRRRRGQRSGAGGGLDDVGKPIFWIEDARLVHEEAREGSPV
ncbi:hypothetical protein SCUCBS95973_007399 [Sporothrix curviconia]|uniref:Uncharacterized protein n=1 Tax=Sporothrix curviconia TaxID=1260050 RepID=A0ABP0CD04_9PEZI